MKSYVNNTVLQPDFSNLKHWGGGAEGHVFKA